MGAGKRVCVVTGGSSGIGRATAELFAANGYTVYEISRSGEDRKGADGTILVRHLTADVTKPETLDAAYKGVFEREGALDVLVNNAGFGISGAIEYTDEADAKRQLDVNFFGCVNSVKAALPYLRKGGGKAIVNVSSVAAVFAIPFQAFYSASKAAINEYTLALRNELAPFGFRVSAVQPGDVRTGFTDARKKSAAGEGVYGPKLERAVASMEKDERNGLAPEDVARVIFRQAGKKNPAPLVTVGGKYKVFCFLGKVLPARAANRIVGKLYG